MPHALIVDDDPTSRSALADLIARDDGRYDILITCFTNPEFPLIRYQIGDVTDRELMIPERGFAQLHNVAGRENQLLRSASGRWLNGVWFEQITEQHPAIRRYKLHQRAQK